MSRLKRFFASSNSDALLLYNGDATRSIDPNLYYFLDFEIDSSFLLAFRDRTPILFTSPMNRDYADENFKGRVETAKGKELWQKIGEELKECGAVSLDKAVLPASTYSKLLKIRRRFLDASKELLTLRAKKDAKEVSLIKKACAISRSAFESVPFRVGKTEERMAKEVEIALLENGASNAFSPIVQTGPNSRFPHSVPSRRVWKRNEILLVDLGARWQHYCSDFTRCFFSGPCKEERKAYAQLKQITRELAKKCRPGMKAKEIAMLATELFDSASLPKMPHSIGHGVGLEVHEAPSLRQKSDARLEKGNVIALEPAIYGKKFGARFEETIFI